MSQQNPSATLYHVVNL